MVQNPTWSLCIYWVDAVQGKGKVKTLQKLIKCPKFQNAFNKLGEEWIEPNDVTNIWRNLSV